ncbi:hypothetical protein pdam_00020399 [Pocillopora damicornis]|uniref:Uncharacterized protein n=1 Tax=Pocillopora damicornis TaxID=46731 RepID=A0A3M6URU0_POCDA|nr:hypothetical protein pdam_00020399 [Pocillopora damicornis]
MLTFANVSIRLGKISSRQKMWMVIVLMTSRGLNSVHFYKYFGRGLSSSKVDGGGGGGTFLNSEGELCGDARGEFLGEFHGELKGDDLEDVPGEANGDTWVTTRVGEVGDCELNWRFRRWGKGGGASSDDRDCSVFSCLEAFPVKPQNHTGYIWVHYLSKAIITMN